MHDDPLRTTLLDLDAALNWDQHLILGGGYGLFLKQRYLADHPEIQTLFSVHDLPEARTTKDIDLILRAEVVTDSVSMKRIREALDALGFSVVETAKYMQFVRPTGPGEVKIDFLAAPLGQHAADVPSDSRRVKPRPSVGLHASKLEEALAVDRDAMMIPLKGHLSTSHPHTAEVLIPQAFSYLLMKLLAFRDRLKDENKDLGRHHALDIYRIVGLLTKDEDATVKQLSREFAAHPTAKIARDTALQSFIDPDGIGRLRIREHPLFKPKLELDRFAEELRGLLAGDL